MPDLFRSLKSMFDALLPPPPGADPQEAERTLQLAAAVMLVEVMRADGNVDATERAAVLAGLRETFGLGADDAARLADLAEGEARRATDLFAFTSHIDERFDMPAKLRMVELMWGVAYADGTLGAHERHVMWRVGDLLHVPAGALQHARLRAMARHDERAAPDPAPALGTPPAKPA